ncbi:class I SAM-dependent methyltransferase [Neobacillus sp. WH10]|uniref:class I SAM-dependent methyltransferase n=1 Tax=Neobacillus sp. WH10 TaxID=3047873 RepID=UPI0024C1E949|nr:class I SAM-dependent methyltransferase [Neobacillus sp. WH10]WHY79538.1 class I SAM-dependent methyltransferase [Neobacillus sp. WH10]
MTNNNPSLILDHTLNQFYSEQDDVLTFIQFCQGLNLLRKRTSRNDWVRFIKEIYLDHPLRDFIIQEPFTQHAFYKSKDNVGSVLMDFIYSVDGLVQAPFTGYETARGKNLFNSLMSLSSCIGIRKARNMIERKIEYVLCHKKNSHFLSIPSGNLREIPNTKFDSQLFLSSIHALDWDEEALFRIDKEFGLRGIKTHHITFLNFTKILKPLQPFDFIWSNGLLNNVKDTSAEELIQNFFNYLKPGGAFILTGFHPTHLLCGYLEVCCDWWPIYRDESQLLRLVEKLPKEKIDNVKTYMDPTGTIVFLEIVKAS